VYDFIDFIWISIFRS